MNIAARYTRRLVSGDFSQGQAFWAILVPALLLIKFATAMLSLMNAIQNPVVSTRIWLPIIAVVICLILPLLFATTIRAIYISAQKFQGGHHSLLLVLALCYALYLTTAQVVQYWPYLTNMVSIATKQSDMNMDIRFDPQTQTLTLEGQMGYDASKALQQAIKEHPDVKTVNLNLDGGQLHEARAMSYIIIRNKLDTEVTDLCSASCMLVLVGGHQRIAHEGATLRFHRDIDYDNGYRNEFVMERERSADRDFYKLRGVAESYLHPIYYKQRNDDYLEPGLNVLYSYGVINDIRS